MIGEVFQGLGAFVLLGFGVAISAIALSVRVRGPMRPVPVPRLNGWWLFAAAVLFWAGGRLGMQGLEQLGIELDLVSTSAVFFLAGGLTWLVLRLRAGGVPAPTQGFDWRWTLSSYVFALPGLLTVLVFNRWLLGLFHEGEVPKQEVLLEIGSASGWTLAVGILAAVVLHPVLEEFLFRGYLWRALAGRIDFGPRRALFFTALAFALAHPIGAWVPAFYLGLFFGWVYWRTGDVGQAVVAHAVHNGLGLILATQSFAPSICT